MTYYALEYELAPNSDARREKDFPDHLKWAQVSADRGDMILGGVLIGESTNGLMVFRADSAAVAEDFVRNDPFVTGGSVAAWRVREWKLSIGPSDRG